MERETLHRIQRCFKFGFILFVPLYLWLVIFHAYPLVQFMIEYKVTNILELEYSYPQNNELGFSPYISARDRFLMPQRNIAMIELYNLNSTYREANNKAYIHLKTIEDWLGVLLAFVFSSWLFKDVIPAIIKAEHNIK